MTRLIAASLVLALSCTAPARADLTDMTPAERESFRAEVKAYLLENPEVLIEAMDVLTARQAELEAQNDAALLQTHAAEIFNDPASWVGGNPEGDITVVEFTDYRCGYCRKAYDEVAELVKSDGNIRFVVKEYPILGEESLISARFAIAVRQVGGDALYDKAHDALIRMRGKPTPDTLGKLARDLGLDPASILARMDSDEVAAVIAANRALGEQLQINGTPTFVINDTMVRGYVPLDGMREIVKAQREG
ncbi:MAG: thioredoxin domain-containing protein [Rhodobacter sp.]|nr:thioredoxin domain-containing protein [Rhodobacter sp.]